MITVTADMEITVAENAGFCFGVERAVKLVLDLINETPAGEKIYTIGDLIHNPHIISELRSKGVESIESDEIDAVYAGTCESSPSVVVVRTHGIEKQISDKLAEYEKNNKYFRVVDCTCPYVKKIHNIVSSHEKDDLIIVGNPEHPEVRGIKSYSSGNVLIFENYDKLSKAKLDKKSTIMVAQTTQKLTEWKKCQNFIRKVYTNVIIFDTICKVTENRQTEVDDLSKNVDALLVIGGRESSNTNKLYNTAKRNLDDVYFIETPSEVPIERFSPNMRVGITAGASTPGSIIEEVKKIMENLDVNLGESEKFEDFADMLEKSFKTLNTGEIVSGVITSVSANELHVDLGTKVTGIIPFSEITDDTSVKLADVFKVGDTVEAMVTKVSDRDGVANLSKKRVDSIQKWSSIMDAFNNETVIEGKVTDVVKGGVVLNCDSLRVFVPASQTGIPKDGDMKALLGTKQKARIIDVNESRRRAVASIRLVLSEERKKLAAEFWANIEEGKHYNGVVKSLTSYGAFVDLGGVDGMIHSSELSWKHIKHPSEVVSVGDTVDVFIKSFDPETKRISLGYKTEESNPWNIFLSKYALGDVASVKIVSLMPYGAFAEVVPGVDGLIHISQIADRKIDKPDDVLKVGDVVDAKIIDINEEKHNISLSVRALIESDGESEEETEAVDEAADEAVDETAEVAVEAADSETAEEAPAEVNTDTADEE